MQRAMPSLPRRCSPACWSGRRPPSADRQAWRRSREGSTPRGREDEADSGGGRSAPGDGLVQSLFLARPFAFLLGGPLVVLALALGEAEFELDPAPGEVEVERYEGIAGALDLADELVDLRGVHQQLAGPRGIRLHMGRGFRQGGDVAADEEELAVAQDDEGFLD